MVFASVLVDVLNKFLEPYVERLDTSHLKVGIWNGNVKLDNIQLKKDLFKEFDLPIKVKASHIGNIEMKIPWKNLTKDVIVVTIDEIYIVLEPELDRPYNPEEDVARQQKKKDAEIKKLEEAAKKLKEEQKKKLKKGKKEEEEKPDTFTEKLVSHLVKNLLVKIKDVHIRYEDTVTNPSTTAMGVTLHSLELKSTDADWKQSVSKETATLIYKLVELNSLAVYFNTFAQSLGSLPEEQLLQSMRDQIARPGLSPPPVNTYLLRPVSALARVKVNLRPGTSLDVPQLFASLECEHIAIVFMEKQFKSLMITLDAFDRHALRQKYLKYRPPQSVTENKRAWWLYAYNSVLDETVRRKLNMWSWKHIKEHRIRCHQYTNKYYEKLSSHNPSSSLLKNIAYLEARLDVFNIMMCRKIAKRMKKKQIKPVPVAASGFGSPLHSITSITSHGTGTSPTSSLDSRTGIDGGERTVVVDKKKQKELTKQAKLEREKAEKEVKKLAKAAAAKEKKEKGKGEKKGFFSKFKKSLKPTEKASVAALVEGGAAAVVLATPTDATVVEEIQETEEDRARKEFYKAIGYSEDEEYHKFSKEYVAYHIGVSLGKVTVELAGDSHTLANLVTSDVNATVRVRPSSNAVSVRAGVGGITATGIPHNGVETRMVTTGVCGREERQGPLVDFQLELNPLERENMDVVVKASVRPLQITYDEDTIDGLIAAFRIRKNLHLQELTSAASSTVGQLKEQTTVGLQSAIQNRKQLEIDVRVQSPYIVVPEKGFYSSDHHLLVVDLGELALTGNTKDPRTLVKELAGESTMSAYYDSFSIKLSNLQVLVAKPGENWQLARAQGSSPLHLLEPTGFGITLCKSIVTDDALLPSLRIDGDIAGFEVHLDDVRLAAVLKIVSTLKLPPPSLRNTTTYYNELPPPPSIQTPDESSFDARARLVRAVSLDTITVASFDEEDDEELDDETRSLSPPDSHVGDQPEEGKAEDTSRIVFTNVSMKLVIRKIGVTVTQLTNQDKEKTLLTVAVNEVSANVQDRVWDLQGSVAINSITVLDYITRGANGQPTYLLKTAGLADGNFISARFVSITTVGKDFALKYTGLQDSASVQVSLVEIDLQQETIAGLIAFGLSLKPALDKPPSPDVSISSTSITSVPTASLMSPGSPARPSTSSTLDKDVSSKQPSKPQKEFHIEARFEGIHVSVGHHSDKVLHSKVTGFSVNADLGGQVTKISASVSNLLVENPHPLAVVKNIVSKADTNKSIIAFEVKVYPGGTSGENLHNMEKVDAAVSAELHRIVAHLDTVFLTNILEFLQKLRLDSQAMVAAYSATAGTATVTANALKDTRAVRVLLDVAINAPLIKIPYSSKADSGTLQVDLGVFRIQNRFFHGYETAQTRGSVVDIGTAQAILDRISVECSSLQVYRTCSASRVQQGVMVKTDILEPLDFTVVVTRNLTPRQSAFFPEVKVDLDLVQKVKFFLASEDIQALINIVLATTKIADVMAPSKQPARPRGVSKAPLPQLTANTLSPPKLKDSTRRLSSYDPDKVVKLSLSARVQSVSLELSSLTSSVLLASSSGLTATMRMNPSKLSLRAGVEKLSIVDLNNKQLQSYRHVLSFTQRNDKVVSAEIQVPLDSKKKKGLNPVADIKLNVSQFHLLLASSFLSRILEFALSLNINPDLVKNATKVAQDSASVATELVQDVYAKIAVSVHAPVMVFPYIQEDKDLQQAFMVDLGFVHVENEVISVKENVSYESYAIALSNFKASRVLLKATDDNAVVVAERVLIQPYSMLVNVERNLCSWYTLIPTISMGAQLGTFKVLLGQEDLEIGIKFGLSLVELLLPLIPKVTDDRQVAVAGAIMEGLTEKDEGGEIVPVVEEKAEDVEKYKKFAVSVVLTEFMLQVFKNEPTLAVGNSASEKLGDTCGLLGFQLVTAQLTADVFSNSDVKVNATMTDMALLDLQEERKERNTGNRVIQHYTSNPLNAYTGQIDKPIFNLEYLLQDKEHFIILKIRNILLITDISFIENVANYFKALFADVKLPELQDTTTKEPEAAKEQETAKVLEAAKEKQDKGKEAKKLNIPTIKLDANIQDFRVALIETVESPEPQALTLKLSLYAHMHLSSETNSKRVSLNMADVSITTSSFYNLDQITSAVLLPFSLALTASGPLDKSAMLINGSVEPITLKLSPSIVRLIIHAVRTLLLSAEKPKPPPAPADLWDRKPILQSKLWYLLPVVLHRQLSIGEEDNEKGSSGEILTLSFEGLELVLENEGTEQCPAAPVLAVNVTAVVQMFDWTSKLTVSADVQCEASYFNTQLSLWEPLLEPLELSDGRLQPWNLHADVTGILMKKEDSSGPKISVSLAATDPLQITITRSSVQLIKDLVMAYKNEYGKKVEGLVNVKSLTGSPFTVVNKLGPKMSLFVKPAPTLKLQGGKEFVKLSDREKADLYFKKPAARVSYASVVTQAEQTEHYVDISIGKEYQNITGVPVNSPGLYYHQLMAKETILGPQTGVVIEVAVTGAKKTITVRSPVQIQNHLSVPIELLQTPPIPKAVPSDLTVIEPGETYPVPFGIAFTTELSVMPTGMGLQVVGPSFMWQKTDKVIDIECSRQGYVSSYYTRVIAKEESFKVEKNLPEGAFAHHIFHVYAPAVVQNLLPVAISVQAEDGSLDSFHLESGDSHEFHQLSLSKPPVLIVEIPDEKMSGKLCLSPEFPDNLSFIVGKDHTTVALEVLHENLGYHRLNIYCPYWMVNKTGLTLQYKDAKSGRLIRHPPDKDIQLLSSEDHKIRLSAITTRDSTTDWSRTLPLKAVGDSFLVTTKLSESKYNFGMAIKLSKFTLSKLVVVTPYYLLVNQTSTALKVWEEGAGSAVDLPGGELIPFWPMLDSNRLHVSTDVGNSVLFNYKTSDSIVLQLKGEIKAVCVEVQETQSSTLITFSSYYDGCAPVQVVNLFPEVTLSFRQDSRDPFPWYEVGPGESLMYTWDDPCARRALRWEFKGTKTNNKVVDVAKDGQESFKLSFPQGASQSAAVFHSLQVPAKPSSGKLLASAGMVSASLAVPKEEMWLSIDTNSKESLVTIEGQDQGGKTPPQAVRGHWKSFIDGLQRVLVFTMDQDVLDRIVAADSVSQNNIDVSVTLKSVGLSLVDNKRKREVAFIGITQSGVIWQVARKRGLWKTLNNTVIAHLEDAYQNNQPDVNIKNLLVNIDAMKMYSPLEGDLRRTNYQGVEVSVGISDKDYSLNVKIGHVQVDNQLPFAVYPQMFYPLPPPPTVASTADPKPFIEAGIILRKTDQPYVNHFKYVHVLIQKMALNVDVGFVLALVEFVPTDSSRLLDAEYVETDMEYASKSLQEITLPVATDEAAKRNFFDAFHLSPIKITLSLNVRGVGRNLSSSEQTVGDRFLYLFLHSLGVILTSVQEAEISLSLFHMEYEAVTFMKLKDLFIKHYVGQGLAQVHKIVLGLDVLGNPVKVVRGVVVGTVDLFYEPIKGSVLGPEEFAEGLGIGLKSFFGGTFGGLTGAGARITGAFGDVFAKLSFDDEFIDRRQQDKVKSNKLGSKAFGFLRNVAEGVTGVVTQPVKGVKQEGAVGLLKGTGKGLVGLLVRPAGGLIDLTSGTLAFVTRKTQVGNIDIVQIRPPRFIARDGAVRPFSPAKAIGNALLVGTNEGEYVETDCYVAHIEISQKPLKFLMVTDRHFMIIEQAPILGGWKTCQKLSFKHFTKEAVQGNNQVYCNTDNPSKYQRNSQLTLATSQLAKEATDLINKGYTLYVNR